MKYEVGSLMLGASLSLLACGSGSDDNASSVDWANGRGSGACHQWQQSYCELAGKCGSTSSSNCAEQMQAIPCVSDTVAADCATSFATATCSTVPSGCDVADVADKAWAEQACDDLLTMVCTHDANCGSSTAVGACVSRLQSDIDCSKAVGVRLNYESCLSKIKSASCSATLPTECKTLIYISS